MAGLVGERKGDKHVGSQAFRVGPGWLTAGAALLMVGVGCRAPATIGDAAILSRELRTEFHRPVAVVLDGQHRLIVKSPIGGRPPPPPIRPPRRTRWPNSSGPTTSTSGRSRP